MKIGSLVAAEYKTGRYIGELLSADGPKAKVRMLAVVKHPTQGNLHHPMQTEVDFFHQRPALHYREVANVMLHSLEPYEGEAAPDYAESLRSAVQAEKAAMEALDTPFGARCLQELNDLEKQYFGTGVGTGTEAEEGKRLDR